MQAISRRTLLAGSVGLTGAGVLSACAPGEATSTTSTTPTAVQTDIASLGDIELVVWDQEVRGSQNDALVALNEEFQRSSPTSRSTARVSPTTT